jgi:adenylate cyclase
MATPKRALRDAIFGIQDLIATETGSPLRGRALVQLESILAKAMGSLVLRPQTQAFTSRNVTVLLADLRGFSSISEGYPSDTVLELLRPYFATMTEVIIRHLGTIDKFMGDSVMALFEEGPDRKGAQRAVTCAVEMQLAMDGLNKNCVERGLPELHMGIGINTGTVMAGLIGTGDYAEYAVIGAQVNLASRIEAFALRGQVLISQSTFEGCAGFAATDNPVQVHVKGLREPIVLHEVTGIPSLGKELPRKEIRRSLRIKAEMAFKYRVVKNKIIAPESHSGRIVDIGYYGVKAELGKELDAYSELHMEIDLFIVGYVASDIYARVLRLRPEQDRFIASIEFTSLSDKSQAHIRRFVQMMVQGSEGG